MLKRALLGLCLVLVMAGAYGEGFSVTDTQGKVHRLEDYKGKWLLVNFWATWCPPCLKEMPDLVALHDAHKGKDLEVLGIAMDYQDPHYVVQFADSMLVSYPIVLGSPKIASQFGPIPGLPTTYLYNPQGKMVAYNVGALTREAVEGYIAAHK